MKLESDKENKYAAKARAYYATAKDKGRMEFHMKWAEQIWPSVLVKMDKYPEYKEKILAVKEQVELLEKPIAMELLGRVGYPLFDRLDQEGKTGKELIGPVIDAWHKELVG